MPFEFVPLEIPGLMLIKPRAGKLGKVDAGQVLFLVHAQQRILLTCG
jgi:hypothetical protein